ncbi:MAG: phosphoribosylglycinamide formyltransferase [Hyphomicrobiales bacterium]|nr:phosphoribosylglycinamide formyltransferase [Hyphomicrobiales bacterium]
MSEKVPIGILISGRGSNMSALLEACRGKDYPCKPVLVVSNRPDAGGLRLAQDAGVPTRIIDHKEFSDRESFETELDKALKDSGAHILCNAGFMRVLTEKFTRQWHDRHLNIHPSLLPSFPGTHSHEQALASGVKITGCTVHYVRAKVDAGPIIAQAATSIRSDDTVETLSTRVLRLEHQLYPYALKLVAEGRAPVVDEQVALKQSGGEESVEFFSPPIR